MSSPSASIGDAVYQASQSLTPENNRLTIFDCLPADGDRVALCLSGGGYRAALYHLGSMRRLNELKLLSCVDTISSVSGGSITAAILAESIASRNLTWPNSGEEIVEQQWDSFSETVKSFTRRNIRTSSVLARLNPYNWGWPPASAESLANKYLRISQRKLVELPERPIFVFCATDMENGGMWISSKVQVGSSGTGFGNTGSTWRIADAVAASSCFPPVFSPLTVTVIRGVQRSAPREMIHLTDGGNYDNTGVEPVYEHHQGLLVSDGGGTFDPGWSRSFLWKLQRYSGILDHRGRTMTKRWLESVAMSESGPKVAMWTIDDHGETDTGLLHNREPLWKILSDVRTDLDAFSTIEADALEWHGYSCVDSSLSSSEFKACLPPKLPDKTLDLVDSDALRKGLEKSHKRKALGRI